RAGDVRLRRERHDGAALLRQAAPHPRRPRDADGKTHGRRAARVPRSVPPGVLCGVGRPMTSRRMRLRIGLGAFLALAFGFIVVDPRGVISPDLRDNLVAETLGAAFTLLVVDLLFEAQASREEKRALIELD